MFELAEIKEYWCLATINAECDEYRILKQSDDLKANEVFELESYDMEYSGIEWADKGEQCPGLYKLVLEPVYEEPDEDAGETEKVFDCLNVISFQLLMAI